jgi:hypothetical protein
MVVLTQNITRTKMGFTKTFSTFAFVSLPLAFSYHMAHNLNHFVRESSGVFSVLINPLGVNTLPLSMAEKHQRHMEMWMSQDILFAIQSILMIIGFIMSAQIIKHRSRALFNGETPNTIHLLPIISFAYGMTAFHLWMLVQPMTMRM